MTLRLKLKSVLVFLLILGMVAIAQQVFSDEKILQVMAVPHQEGTSVPVIMYHHMLNEQSRWGEWTISPDEFKADLVYLKEHGYTTMLISELVSALKGEQEMPKKPIVLTFDDGHESTYAYAFPLLKEYGMKAVVSVIGRYSDLFSEDDSHHISYSYLQWQQIKEMSDSGWVEFGNHSYDLHDNHSRRGCCKMWGESKEEYCAMLREDTQKTQDCLREATGKDCTIYTYPYGAYCKKSQELLKEMGFQVVLGCEEKVNELTSFTPILWLDRFNRPHGRSSSDFFQKIAP